MPVLLRFKVSHTSLEVIGLNSSFKSLLDGMIPGARSAISIAGSRNRADRRTRHLPPKVDTPFSGGIGLWWVFYFSHRLLIFFG
jgi:hypothetical protein